MTKDINYALVEEKRPPIYTAMKYWGKKPHNIWREYIQRYTPEKGIYLDPFVGSAMSAFEAVKAGRKVIAFDLNPLTSFIIEVISSDFYKDAFEEAAQEIKLEIQKDSIYQKYFHTVCRKCGSKKAIVQNYKWNNNTLYELGIVCPDCAKEEKKKNPYIGKNELNKLSRYLTKPNSQEQLLAKNLYKININNWHPTDQFHKSQSFTASFKANIGGNIFSDLWTKRNLYILSRIFNLILKNKSNNLKKQLLFAFIQTLHLCTKMNIPRTERGNRPFSTSWGRSAYICSKRQMEMNPLAEFYGNCIGKQSVESSLSKAQEYLGKKPKLLYIDESNKSNRSKNYDIKYGIIDINTITDYIDEESIDFIMTDPPYGGLVQYLDLSSIWLIWLEKYNKKYKPNYEAEITVNNETQNMEIYRIKFQKALKNLYKILKKEGKIVFTFHNKKIEIWNAFLNAIPLAGFKIEKVIHQQNRRTGESNVANPYGTSASDFYIRCIKAPVTNLKKDKGEFTNFIVSKAIYLIAERNEPTPYQILFDGLLSELSNAGFELEDFDKTVEKILSEYVDKIFKITKNGATNSGNLWWFTNPHEHIRYPNIKLSERVEETIINLLRRKVTVSFDEILGKIFVKYPNGLTPDIKSISKILEKYAIKSSGKWVYKGGEIEEEFTQHTEILFYLLKIGNKLGYKIFVGRREQPEIYKGNKLSTYADFSNLNFLKNYNKEKISRIEMIDMIWLDKNMNIKCAIEVENTTNFTSGIQRASNLENNIEKIMIVPDKRNNEFKRIKDPLFVENFKKYFWRYLLYSEVNSLKSLRNISIEIIGNFLKELK
jgi:16S rRNA G966 N2-methylase RsmD